MEINKKININFTNNIFYYIVNGVDQNNNPVKEEKLINIPDGKYDFSELIMAINELLQNDKGFFKASLKECKVTIDIIKSAYSVDFSKQNTLSNVFGFGGQILTHGKHVSENNFNSNAMDNVFIWCNLIDESYINNRKMNSIYRFRLDDNEINNQSLLIDIEPRQVIYHKVTSRPNKIILKLVDINSNLIDVNNVNLFVELNLKELS
jgi:hypothetical protein